MRGPLNDNHVGELGILLIHNGSFPDGIHLTTIQYYVAKEIAEAFSRLPERQSAQEGK
jgi:hypothetical protein